jgi:hypothetical protein
MGAQLIQTAPGTPPISLATTLAIGAFTGMGWLTIAQTSILVVTAFHNRSSLYFRAIVGSLIGATLWNIGNAFHYFVWGYLRPLPIVICAGLGYLIVVPCIYLVLYSRLHLVSVSRRSLRLILCLIISDYLLIDVPTNISTMVVLMKPNLPHALQIMDNMQKVEGVTALLVEMVMSGTYVYHILRLWGSDSNPKARRISRMLVIAYVFVLSLDAINLLLTYIQTMGLQPAWMVSYKFIHYRLKGETIVLTNYLGISVPIQTPGGNLDSAEVERPG